MKKTSKKKALKKPTKKTDKKPIVKVKLERKKRKRLSKFVQVNMATMTSVDSQTYLPVTIRHIHG
jgi:hypothetical protein